MDFENRGMADQLRILACIPDTNSCLEVQIVDPKQSSDYGSLVGSGRFAGILLIFFLLNETIEPGNDRKLLEKLSIAAKLYHRKFSQVCRSMNGAKNSMDQQICILLFTSPLLFESHVHYMNE